MTTKNIRLWKFGRHALLAGVHNLGLGRNGSNLRNVFRFNRITEYDAFSG
jgi:hypothetical protein